MNFFTTSTILATLITTTLSAPASSHCLAPMTRAPRQPYIIALKPGFSTSSHEATELKQEIKCQGGKLKDTFHISDFQAYSADITPQLAKWIEMDEFKEFVEYVEKDGKVTAN